eukprot:TRINITY_DN2495_c0_g1_i7.p1 TRINITY_DN2495_c0_g1~~TRINITY_DN2495_c0_g1_i7.p1  ORF type:complete len:210 (-),score=65.80 TRINITY_DN2495_c0_g1_i7:32-610(-)
MWFLVAAAALLASSEAYVAPPCGTGNAAQSGLASPAARLQQTMPELEESAEMQSTDILGMLSVSFGVGAVLGWLKSHKQQATSVAAAAAMAVAPAASNAYVDYEGLQYLGGSDKVDINNANVQAYRQFPGMYPTAAGMICTHGPYKSVQEVYDIPGMDDKIKGIIKKYEGNLVSLPANPAYFIDRINNGLYR